MPAPTTRMTRSYRGPSASTRLSAVATGGPASRD